MRAKVLLTTIGASIGAMIGLMFDDPQAPGRITLTAALLGVVASGLAIARLRRCDPFQRFR